MYFYTGLQLLVRDFAPQVATVTFNGQLRISGHGRRGSRRPSENARGQECHGEDY